MSFYYIFFSLLGVMVFYSILTLLQRQLVEEIKCWTLSLVHSKWTFNCILICCLSVASMHLQIIIVFDRYTFRMQEILTAISDNILPIKLIRVYIDCLNMAGGQHVYFIGYMLAVFVVENVSVLFLLMQVNRTTMNFLISSLF